MFHCNETCDQKRPRTVGNNRTKVLDIREHRKDMFGKIIWIPYNMPSIINENLITWIAIPKGGILGNVLFNMNDNLRAVVHPQSPRQDEKDFVKAEVLKSCTVLTVGQRCPYWFVLRQFHVTDTNAGKH